MRRVSPPFSATRAPQSVAAHAQEIGADLWQIGRDFNYAGDKQQWGWAGRQKRFNGLAYPALPRRPISCSMLGALAAFEALRDRLPHGAGRAHGLALVERGAFSIVPGQPTLGSMSANRMPWCAGPKPGANGVLPRTHAVFGAMADKDIPAILKRMAPVVDRWHFW